MFTWSSVHLNGSICWTRQKSRRYLRAWSSHSIEKFWHFSGIDFSSHIMSLPLANLERMVRSKSRWDEVPASWIYRKLYAASIEFRRCKALGILDTLRWNYSIMLVVGEYQDHGIHHGVKRVNVFVVFLYLAYSVEAWLRGRRKAG